MSFRIDGSKLANYAQRLAEGRVVSLHFDDDGDGRFEVSLDRRADSPDWPHCILILDGVPFDTVSELWHEGWFRLFPPPARLISVFPAMTDLALTRILRTAPCVGYEALYFDRSANRLAGGNLAYLRGENAPWLGSVTYHAPQDVGPRVYLSPQSVFDEEMAGALKAFRAASSGEVIAYSVGSAGLGTRGGREAIRQYLRVVEKLCERVVYEKRGRVRLSLMADHGQGLKVCRRVKFKRRLADAGFRLAGALNGPKDVVSPEYGLVTYAAFYTSRPAEVGRVLIDDEAVALAAWVDGQAVRVLSADGEATVEKVGWRFRYRTERGDPLRLQPIIESLAGRGFVSADGTVDDRALFEATAAHDFPDPLHRLWDCFHGLVRQPADLVVSLHDTWCYGSWLFELGIGRVASTHGALDRMSSTTFVLSDVGPLPEAVRVDDVLDVLREARRRASSAGATNSRAD